MKKRENRRAVVVAPLFPAMLFLAIGSLSWTGSAQLQDVVFANRQVRLTLESGTGIKKAWPTEQGEVASQLVTNVIQAKAGDTIHRLLAANHIRPDVEAIGLVYELNPGLENLRELERHPQLLLPAIRPAPELAAELEIGCRVALVLDYELKQDFDTNVKALRSMLFKSGDLAPLQYSDGRSQSAILASITNIVETMDFIRLRILRRNGPPLTAETLDQLNEEAKLLRTVLEPVMRADGKLDEAAREQIAAVERDIGIKRARYVQVASGAAPDPWPLVSVIVRTLRQGQAVPNLRVVYIPEALRAKPEKARPFNTLSSPCGREMPEADYLIWAVSDERGSRVSNEFPLSVRKTGPDPINVDLTILPEPNR